VHVEHDEDGLIEQVEQTIASSNCPSTPKNMLC
jgi:hypothetical protein